jgi:hypothetical protein
MIEATTLEPLRRPPVLRLSWVGSALLHPRQTFTQIAAETRGIWITPLLLLSLTALLYVGAAGWLRGIAAASGEVQLPPDFQYYTPEQQAQVMQALQATSGPVFLYVFPGLLGLATVWLGWLLVSSLVHLAMTALGGRGSTTMTLNLVAWAGLPLMLRDLVRVAAMLSTDRLLGNPGLSGFVTPGEGHALFLASLLVQVDLYLIWTILLMTLGARAASGASTGRAFLGITLSVLLAMVVRAGLATGVAFLGTLSVVRPFFF